VWKIKNYKELRKKGTSYTQYSKGGLTVLVTCCVGTAFLNMLLMERWKRWKDEEE
jgi:hypothetical protein